jgi:adenylate cyclase
LYSADEDNNNTSDVERERYPKPQSDTTNSMVDMLMGASTGSSANSGEAQQITVDAKTLIAQTQDRMWKALKRRYQYDSNLNPAQMFLLNHINSKIPLAIHVRRFSGLNQHEYDFTYR